MFTLQPQYGKYYNRYDNSRGLKGESYVLRLNGKGTIEVKPNMAVINLGVITENKDLKIAQRENAQRTSKVIESLKKNGVADKDITTINYSIEPQYEYSNGKQTFLNYKVSNILRVNIKELDNTGDIIDEAVKSGANTVSNLVFTLEDPDKYYRQALNIAIEDAIRKAKDIERNLCILVNKTPIRILEENSNYAPSPRMLLAGSESTPIQQGTIQINSSIKADFAYLIKS